MNGNIQTEPGDVRSRSLMRGLGLASALVLTTSIEVGELDLNWVWNKKEIPERKRLDILETAIAYRKKCLDSPSWQWRDNDTPG